MKAAGKIYIGEGTFDKNGCEPIRKKEKSEERKKIRNERETTRKEKKKEESNAREKMRTDKRKRRAKIRRKKR